MSGLEFLCWAQKKQQEQPDIPSIGRLLGMEIDEVDEGRVVMSLNTRPDYANPLGTVHGGIAATLLDSVRGCAVHTTLPPRVGYTTLELKVNYIRAVPLDAGKLTAQGTVIHTGRRTATTELLSAPAEVNRTWPRPDDRDAPALRRQRRSTAEFFCLA
ncbi:PaaI family thioesterase [Streptomyces sp. S186]|uniref:PaaI family thioesterase n=1 Tax=Streptomyces sp. S186 TaxID=3434395 RepID=UPI003F675A79